MKFAIHTAALFLLLGAASFSYARQEKGPGGHEQEAKPAAHEAKPAEQKPAAQPAARQQAQAKPAQEKPQAKPVERQQTQAKPAQQQHTQQAARPQQQKAQQANHSQPAGGSKGGTAHGRISDVHYAASFGSGHSFHVNRGDYSNHRFAYGGYSFGFVDPWPVAWGYSDDVYVVYTDGGYWMYDNVHPGLRISINIL